MHILEMYYMFQNTYVSEMLYNIMSPLMTIELILLNLYFHSICSYSTVLQLFSYLLILTLSNCFCTWTCLSHYQLYLFSSPASCTILVVGSLYTWAIQLMRAYASFWYNTFYPTGPSRLFGYGCQPYSLASVVYITFSFNIYYAKMLQ